MVVVVERKGLLKAEGWGGWAERGWAERRNCRGESENCLKCVSGEQDLGYCNNYCNKNKNQKSKPHCNKSKKHCNNSKKHCNTRKQKGRVDIVRSVSAKSKIKII